MKKGRQKIFFLTLAVGVFLTACGVNNTEELIRPGRLKILLEFTSSAYKIEKGDSLFLQARDFKVYRDSNFADVFQNPKQFLAYEDSIVSFNMLEAARKDSMVQVAYGSVPPLEYDSLKFLLVPGDVMRLEGNEYPITTDYTSLGDNVRFSTVVKISSKIRIQENKNTTLVIRFATERNVFRYLDRFVFAAVVDTFYFKK